MSVVDINTLPPSQCPTECQASQENVNDLVQSVLNIRISHGVTMAACWIIIYPLGIVFARYFKGWSRWMEVHAFMQKLGTTGAISLVLANTLTRTGGMTSMFSFHSLCGFVMVAGLIAQICMGTAHKARLGTFWVEVPALFKALPATHATLGSCLLMLAPFQMVSGMRRYWGYVSWQEIVYYVIIGIWAVVFTYLEVRKYKADQLAKIEDKANPFITDEAFANLKVMTWESVITGCMHDAEWIVIRNVCYDVRSWRAAHPGGQGRLTQMFGHDATNIFINGPHAHSSTAWRKMATLAVGRLDPSEAEELAKGGADAFMFQLLTVTKVEVAGSYKRITCATPLQMLFAKPGVCMPVEKPTRSSTTTAASHEHKSGLAPVAITAIVNMVETGTKDLAARFGMGEKKEAGDVGRKVFMYPGQYMVLKATTPDEQAVRQLERPFTPFHSEMLKSDVPPTLSRALSAILPKGPVQTLDFVIKTYKHGKMSKVVETIKVGSQVSVRGPLGAPVLNAHSSDGRWNTLFLIAGGSGITPMLQYLHYHLDYEEDNPNNSPIKWPVIHLVWCSHDGSNLLALKLSELEAKSSGRFRFTMPSGGPDGASLNRPAFDRAISGKSTESVQLTGSLESTKLTQKLLQIVYEQTFDFVVAPIVPTSPPASPKSPPSPSPPLSSSPSLSPSPSPSSSNSTLPRPPSSGTLPRPPSHGTMPRPPSLATASSLTGGSTVQLVNGRKWERLFGLDSTKVLVCGPPGFLEAAGEFSRSILGPELAKSVLHIF